MMSFYRSGLLALTLVSGCLSVAGAAETQRMRHEAWFSDMQRDRLQDESVLVEYFGESAARERTDVFLRIGFVPRFGCAPLISLNVAVAEQSSEAKKDMVKDFSYLFTNIDGTPLSFPVLVDEDKNRIAVYLHGDLQQRIATRVKLDGGTVFYLQTASGKQLSFSLQGSRNSVSLSERACREHDPKIQ